MEGPTTSQPPPDNAQDEEVSKLDLPEQLQKITPATELPTSLGRWNSNEEIAAILIAFDRHKEWLLVEPRIRPPSGSLLLYNRKKVSFRRDGYCWKKRRDGKTNREDHMKLKVKGVECIYGSYVHSAILPTFHRRCYWLLQNPHVVLVHYLNVPNHPNNPKPSLMPILSGEMRKKEWTKEELVDQLRPMLASGRQGELHPDQDHTVEETLEAIFQLLVSAQDDGNRPKPLAVDTGHQHPCGTLAPAPTFMAHRGLVGLATTHPQVQCAPHTAEKPGVLCLQQQSGQLGGCVSTMAHLQVSTSTVPDHHSHQVLQNQMPHTAAVTVTSATAPLSALHAHHDLQLPMATQLAQHAVVPATTVPSTLSPMTLATFSHVHLAAPAATLHTVPVTRESQLQSIAPAIHEAAGQTIIPASMNLMQGLSVGDCFQGTTMLPAGSVSHTSTSSDSQNLPQHHTFPTAEDLNLLKSADQLVSTPQPATHLQTPLQQQHQEATTTCVNGINNNNAQSQSLNTSNVIHLSPTNLVVKDGGNSLGSIPSVVAFASTTNNYVSTPHLNQQHSLPGPSKDIPLFAANPLAQNTENNGCDGDGSGVGGGVGVDGLVDNSDNCDTLDGSFSSLPSTDLNLDLFLDLQDLEDCAADLAAATSLSPPPLPSPSSPLNSSQAHQPLATSSPLGGGGSQGNSGGSPGNACNISNHVSNNHIGTLPGSYVHSAMTTPNAQLPQPQPQMLGGKLIMPSVWGTVPTTTEIPSVQSHAQPVYGTSHVAMAQDSCEDSSNKAVMDRYANSAQGQFQQQQQQQACSSAPSNFGTQQNQGVCSDSSRSTRNSSALEHASAICDFSPEWAYTEGNTKILVAGPWCNPRVAYTCVFDGIHIPATLVQAGVLRCYTPAHEAGQVVLQVAQDGFVISNNETFEFRAHIPAQQSTSSSEPQLILTEPKSTHCDPHSSQMDWFDMNNVQLKLLLLERLGELERRFISGEKSTPLCSTQALCVESQESSLLAHVETLTKLQWSSEHMYPKAGCGGLTLLHLTSALGYAKLISTLIRWRNSNPSPALEYEVDAHSVDNHACTPLMWACAKGQIDAALTLYHWNGGPLRVCNKDGHLPLAVARQRGHHNLAAQVEQLEQAHFKAPAPAPAKIRCQNRDTQVSSLRPGPDSESLPQPMSPETIKVEQSETVGNHSNIEQSTPMQTSQVAPSRASHASSGHGKLVRRFSEQVISPSSSGTHHPLSKRYSVDVLTPDPADPTASSPSPSYHMRDSTSEPRLPSKQDIEFRGKDSQRVPSLNFVLEPDSLLSIDREMRGTDHTFLSPHSRGQLPMDTDEVSPRSDSPFIDVERVSSDDEQEKQDDSKHQMVTLANQIIAAMPERIKLSPSKGDDDEESSCIRTRSESHSSSAPSQGSPRPSSSSFGDDSGISTPMTDSLAFEEYRYTDFGTPASSLSPDSTCLPSPYSPYSFALDSPPPTTAEFTEYFNAPATYMEKDFSQLTLSDQEQRKLYEAAKVIQNAYRHYRDKQQQQQHQKEIEAAVLIQSYYRRYKQYAYYKKMTQAAVLIQNQFRSYSAQKRKKNPGGSSQGSRRELERLKKGRNQSVIIQQRFRSHYQRKSLDGKDGAASMGMGGGDAPDSSPPPAESQQCQEANPSADETAPAATSAVTDEPDHVDVTEV